MPLTDDGGIISNEKTNELATLIPQCMLDFEGEFFFLRLVVGAVVSVWRFWC